MYQGHVAKSKKNEQSLFPRHYKKNLYNNITDWIYAQQKWVTLREVAQHFGLSRAELNRCLNVIAAKRPSVGLQQSLMYNQGDVSVRVLVNSEIWKPIVQEKIIYPVPFSTEHARWLALVQLPWSRLASDERFQGMYF
ncbi:MAG: hypothetical protein ACRDC6_29430 [Shewanella sp.]